MRRRLLVSTVAVVLVALLLFAVPLGVAVTRVQRDGALETFAQQLQQVAAFLSDRAVTVLGAQLILRQAHDVIGGRLILSGPQGEVVADSAPLPARPLPPTRAAREPVATQRSGRLEAFVPVPDLPGYVLSGVRPDRELVAANRRAWLVIGGLGALVLTVAAGAAL
ncbi:MAG TPA: hypothetical protein VHF25_00265, partial [Nitriliruptorales bacterium]|nr:hypothetical protein [Nitriliruptorales bacterium]